MDSYKLVPAVREEQTFKVDTHLLNKTGELAPATKSSNLCLCNGRFWVKCIHFEQLDLDAVESESRKISSVLSFFVLFLFGFDKKNVAFLPKTGLFLSDAHSEVCNWVQFS